MRSLQDKFRPKVTTISEAKYLNKWSLESMIRNLWSHEMEPNGDDPVVKSKTLALKYMDGRSDGKAITSSKVWKSEEISDKEASAGDSDEQEMAFIIRRFQQLSRKNKIFSGKSNGFRGSSSKDNTDDQNNCFNYKKLGHFRADCPDFLKERLKKGGLQKDSFRNKLKKSLMAMTLSDT